MTNRAVLVVGNAEMRSGVIFTRIVNLSWVAKDLLEPNLCWKMLRCPQHDK